MKFHINSSRVFISIIFYDAAQVKNKMNTILFYTWVCLWNISVFITTIIIVFAYFAQNNLPICPFLFLFVLCRSRSESLKCKYINTKLPCCCSISRMSKLAFRVVFYCQRSYQVAENFINHKTLFGLGVYQNENLLALKYLAILDLCSFRFVSYPSRFFFFYFFPLYQEVVLRSHIDSFLCS